MNSKAGYIRSGVARLTLRQEDSVKEPPRRHQEPDIKEGMEIMQRKAAEAAEEAQTQTCRGGLGTGRRRVGEDGGKGSGEDKIPQI